MSLARPVPAPTREAQARASDPAVSAWVSANAGSGKTHVLAQRVIRLLLTGVAPARILCLTFTKVAAANMAARIFETLAGWTTLDDTGLSARVAAMTGARPTPVDLLLARRLFARAVDTPGGLKIQTIHAFCERLLHLFPFEANVAAKFEVAEDLRQADLLGAARAAALGEAAGGARHDLAQALRTVTAETTGATFGTLIGEMIGARGQLGALMHQYRGEDLPRALARRLGLAPGEDVESIDRAMVENGLPPAEWEDVARTLGADLSGKNSTASRLAAAAAMAEAEPRRKAYLLVFLTQELQPRADLYLPKPLRQAHPSLCARLDRERDRLTALVDSRRAALAVRRTAALLTLGQAILGHYARLKAEQNLLDFDDLIAKTLGLLTRSNAAWVLYKLDSGIDHILVDEAQDTSSDQWLMLQRLAAEFTAGEGARGLRRTFFAVGDEKQSIFSFQGAAPHMFDKMRRFFESKIRNSAPPGATFAHVPLHLSFRSVPAVLEAVDDVFSAPENFAGLSFDADQTKTVHESFKQDLPGRIEIWDTIAAKEKPDPKSWSLPLDVHDEQDPPVVLARRIAATIKSWTGPGSRERVHDERDQQRPIRPGDFLLLVRVRGPLFEALIRAVKDHAVPVAGADRMVLTNQMAVMDLIAAGRAALLRDDDLSLACVLKSPLFSLTDEDLLAIAPHRNGSLADAIDVDPRYAEVAARLERWRGAARRSAPFEFYMMLVAQEGGRKRFAARLGPEADDAIDEFLRLALDHEREGPPSLARFLAAIEAAELSIKRDMETAGDSVRVMTVHAAKGLEAKIVILADTCGVPSARHDPKLFSLETVNAPAGSAPFIVWSARRDDDPAAVAEAREIARRQAIEEHRRLLYVAMTRAEERLVIAGHEGKPKSDGSPNRPAGCWYDMVLQVLRPTLAEMPAPWDPEEKILWRGQGVGAEAAVPAETRSHAGVGVPEWLGRSPPLETAPRPPLKPSNALAAADGFDRPDDMSGWDPNEPAARAEGLLMHTLLQHLPDLAPQDRRDAAMRFLAARGGAPPAEKAAALVEAVVSLLGKAEMAPLFGPQSRAEVEVAGRLMRMDGSTIAVAGRIDRLALTETEVIIADFKTGRPPPGAYATDDHVAQAALYRAVVAGLYPDRQVRALLVWTDGPRVVELEPSRLDAALRRAIAV